MKITHPSDLELSATLLVTETHSPVCGVLPGSSPSSHSASAAAVAVVAVVAVSTVESSRLEAEVVVVVSWGLSTSPSMSIRPEEEEGRAETLRPQMDDRRVP